MADVFLSYSSKDRTAAHKVQQALTRRDIDVFWDQETPAGTDWDTWTRGKLAESRVAIVLWSKNSVGSDSVRHEAMLARKADKLLPVMIDNLSPEDLPMGLYMVQSVVMPDWSDLNSKGMNLLIAETEARLGRKGAAVRATRMQKKTVRKSKASPPIFLAVLGLAVAVAAGALWIMQQDKSGAATPAATAAAASGAVDGMFSKRIEGRWITRAGQSCASGWELKVEDGKLVFTDASGRFVHLIEADDPLETRTRVAEPEFVLGEQYVLEPEFNATSDERSFNLIVKNLTAGGEPETWSPCEL
jgi:hypothetical protein